MRVWAALFLLVCAGSARAQDFQWPVTGPATQCFGDGFSGQQSGYYYDPGNTLQWFGGYSAWGWKLHRAVDIGVGTGTPVRAARGGTAWRRGSTSHFYGYHMVVDHGSGYWSLYAHLSSWIAASGAWVSGGELLAYSGATGNVTGPHLHFEIRHSSDSNNYAPYAHHVPCSGIVSGWDIPFDYPGIGDAPPPPAPGGLWSWNNGNGSATLGWDDVGGDDHEVYLEYWDGGAYVFYGDWNSGNPFTFWPAVGSAWYRWWVRAHNGGGWGEWSGSHEFYFEGGGPPPSPDGLRPQWPYDGWVVYGSSATLTWDALAGATDHHVTVEVWTGSTYVYYWDWYSGSGANSFTFWPASGATWYRWWVRAANSAGWGAWSGGAEFWFN